MARTVQHAQIEEIRRRTDIVALIGSRVTLKRAGSNYKACCPFHKEKTPSFVVNPSRQSYKCFGCGEGGDALEFLMKHDGMSFGDALKMLADRCGVELSYGEDDGMGALRKRLLQLHEELATFYHKTLLEWPGAAHAREYVASRELPQDIVSRFRIGFAPAGRDVMTRWAQSKKFSLDEMTLGGILTQVERDGRPTLHDRFRGRLMFPICDTQGHVVAFSARLLEKNDRLAKYVNSPETPIFSKGRILYALDKAQKNIVSAKGRRAIICEGQIDVIRCHASGFTTAVASQGTAFTQDHVTLLKRYADSAVLVFDSDGAGQKAAIATARVLLASGIPVRVARLPEGKDPDDFLRHHPPEDFTTLLDQAEEIVPFQIRHLRTKESHPEGADAVGRISGELIETLRLCSNTVHQARMLQDAAALLGVPEAALSAQFEKEVALETEREARRKDSENAYGKIRAEQARLEQARLEAESVLMPIEDEPMVSADDVETSGAVADSATSRKMRPEEFTVCVMLLHRMDDMPDVARFLEEWLPLELFQHPYSRQFVGAVFEAVRDGKDDAIAALHDTATPDFAEFLRHLAVALERSGKKEFSDMDAAKDLVLAFWKRRLQQEQDTAAAGSAEPGSAEHQLGDTISHERHRLRLAMEIQKMRNWDTAHDAIYKARERLL